MTNFFSMTANPVVAYLRKPAAEFTKEDIVRYAEETGVKMVNFMYPGGDGKLKTLNFVITDKQYLEAILTCGERVDGSSLFSFVQAGSSDLYVLPRFSTAFLDPFAEIPTLCMLCSFFDKDGALLESAPENTLAKACKTFTDVTGMEFHAMGELEYYVIFDDDGRYPAIDQHGYHESAPYAKANEFRAKCMLYIAQAGGQIKYGHSEVGNFVLNGKVYEQNEIEFLPVRADHAADQLMLAKWVIRNLAYQMGLNVTFAYREGWQEYDVGERCSLRQCSPHDSRHDGIGAKYYRFWQQEPHVVFPPCAPSGGTYECVLGRPQPLRARACAIGMDGRCGYVGDCESWNSVASC